VPGLRNFAKAIVPMNIILWFTFRSIVGIEPLSHLVQIQTAIQPQEWYRPRLENIQNFSKMDLGV
jgi:hypothetical protein